MGKKRKARKLREGKGEAYVSHDYSTITSIPQEEGQYPSTHLMVDNIFTAKKGEYKVWPSIGVGPLGKYHAQSFEQAKNKGELFKFKSRKRAEKFAHGSWKKGKDKREAMKAYRQYKKEVKNPVEPVESVKYKDLDEEGQEIWKIVRER